ncbi:MAG: hypothetical protein R6U93_05390 [Dehalococcoidia bacterium]
MDKRQSEGGLLYDLGNGQRDIPEVRRLLIEILPCDSVFGECPIKDDFCGIDKRRIMLNGRRLELEGTPRILVAVEDMTGRGAHQSG